MPVLRLLLAIHALALLTLGAGCYQSHELPPDGAVCAFAGVHTVNQRTISSSCGGPLSADEEREVVIPPTRETFALSGNAEIVETAPCRWEVSASDLLPDVRLEVDGWIDASDGRVRGRFEILSVATATAAECHIVREWSPRE